MSMWKCWSGRKWINIGKGIVAIGFGPTRLIERIMIARRYVYIYRWNSSKDKLS